MDDRVDMGWMKIIMDLVLCISYFSMYYQDHQLNECIYWIIVYYVHIIMYSISLMQSIE